MTPKPTAFVTGAAQGIGLATAERLARDGFEVVAMDRQAEPLEPAVAALCAQGLPVLAAVCDVCDRAALAAVTCWSGFRRTGPARSAAAWSGSGPEAEFGREQRRNQRRAGRSTIAASASPAAFAGGWRSILTHTAHL